MCHIGGFPLEALINWFRGLSRAVQTTIIIAICLFTPVVSIAFSMFFGGIGAACNILGFMLGLLNWKGVLFLVIVGIVFAGKAGYNWIMSEDEDIDYCSRCAKYNAHCNCWLELDGENDENSWNPFR